MDAIAGLLGTALLIVSVPMAIIQRKTRLRRWLFVGLAGALLFGCALNSDNNVVPQTIAKVNTAIEKGDYAEARAMVKKALERFPKSPELESSLNRVVVAETLHKVEGLLNSKDIIAAKDVVNTALAAAPGDPALAALLARVRTEEMGASARAFVDGISALKAGQYEQAMRLLKLVIADDPNYSSAQLSLASSRDSLSLDYYNQGVRARAQKNYAEAERLFALAKETGGKAPARLETELATVTKIRQAEEAAAAAKAEKERQEAARIAALLGPKPENSAWDGAVEPVMRFLRSNLKDPKSLDVAEWSAVSQITWKGQPYWGVRCKYRAKNSFGGYVIEQKLFLMRQNTVVTYFDI